MRDHSPKSHAGKLCIPVEDLWKTPIELKDRGHDSPSIRIWYVSGLGVIEDVKEMGTKHRRQATGIE
jgi:hypothetical protein